MAKKAKARVILIRLISSANTGTFYTTTKKRLAPKMALMKFDPKGMFVWRMYNVDAGSESACIIHGTQNKQVIYANIELFCAHDHNGQQHVRLALFPAE